MSYIYLKNIIPNIQNLFIEKYFYIANLEILVVKI